MSKTHYRNVFKSDHLSAADLDDYTESGSNLVFNISHVTQHQNIKVAGRNIKANIAHFKDTSIKNWVINAGNCRIMCKLANSTEVKNWNDMTVQLYVDPNATLAGEVVGGIRVSPKVFKTEKPVITKGTIKLWNNAKAAYVRDNNFNEVLKRAILSKENQDLIKSEIKNA